MDTKKLNEVQYLLINTPLTDPTCPYHSIPYLIGAASHAGFANYFCIDANIEALNYVVQKEQVTRLLDDCESIRVRLERKTKLTRGEQLIYRYSLKALGFQPDSAIRAVESMKNPNTFYNYEIYRQAVMVLNRWMDILSIKGFPGQFEGMYLDTKSIFNASRVSDLTNDILLDRLTNPFSDYFRGPFKKAIEERRWDFIGLSVNYTFQLPFALWMCKYIRTLSPNSVISIGGTEISDVIKYLREPSLIWRLFSCCDILMVGEGETALIRILESLQSQKPLPKQNPGILVRDEFVSSKNLSVKYPVMYEDVSELSEVKYDIWDWKQYWSPEPVVLYSPTRGCYWNKCTFCDYGLNTDSPTSPSRERPIELAVKDLAKISKFARTVYFAVDAMSPAYLRRLAKGLAENGVSIRWSAELRLERSFKGNLASDLKKAGCVAISFGYESGSQRILDLINKGVNLQEVPQILKQLSNENIGVQMMGFIGFPGENTEEALATYIFLRDTKSDWTLAGIGDFVLTSGSIIAKKPEYFGINEVHPHSGNDIARSLDWVHENGQTSEDNNRTEQINNISISLKSFNGNRPFVGGIDSSHSILYFAQFGKQLVQYNYADVIPSNKFVDTVCYKTPHQAVDQFTDKVNLEEFCGVRYSLGQSVGFNEIRNWLDEYPESPEIDKDKNTTVEIYPSGVFLLLTSAERQMSPTYHALKELLLCSKGVL
jgi:anaerobic magnesium-protoporphyrin IX monomethyl ester cyclase